MDYKFKPNCFTGAIKLRWLNANCYEIKLPDDTTIITDPFLPAGDCSYEKWQHYYGGVDVNDLTRADYAIIGHAHADHLGSLPELYDRFYPRILVHSSYAMLLTTDLHIPSQMIFPFDNNQHYEFPEFSMDTTLAHHNGPRAKERPEQMRKLDEGTIFETLNSYGPMFNTNFIITTENNVKIGFVAGTLEYEERMHWEKAGMNIVLRQVGGAIRSNDYTSVAKDIMDLHVELLLPLHHESTYGVKDIMEFTEKVNEILIEEGYPGRMFMPERNRWYRLGMNIIEE